MDNKLILKGTKSFTNFKGTTIYRAIFQAVHRFKEQQGKDEKNYRDTILGFERYGRIFRNIERKNKDLSAGDMVYGYLYEEDIRIRLAYQLIETSPNAQIHGQILVNKTYNRKRNGHSVKPDHMYPDLLFTLMQQKTRKDSSHDFIPSAAIEIKYFGSPGNEKNMKKAISADLKKLINYTSRRVSFRTDFGLFFCIDESGKAEDMVKKYLKEKIFRNYPLGYVIILPEYAVKDITFPRFFEKFEQGNERNMAVILDLALTELSYHSDIKMLKIKKDEESGGVFSYIDDKKKNQRYGWIELIDTKRIYDGKKRRKNHAAVVVCLNSNCKSVFDGEQFYKWDGERYISSKKNNGRVIKGYINMNFSKYKDLKKESKKIFSILKKIIRSAR